MFEFFTDKSRRIVIGYAVAVAAVALNTLWWLIGAGIAAANVAGICVGLAAFAAAYGHERLGETRPRLARVLYWSALGGAGVAAATWLLAL